LERAAPDLPPGSVAAGRATLLLGWPQGIVRPVPAHLHWLRQAATVTEPLDPQQRMQLRCERAVGLLMLGEEEGWAAADPVPDDAATAPERMALTVGLMNIGEMARVWGRYAEAGRRLAAALAMAERDGHVRCRS